VNPSGEVPTVEVDGKFVPESEICAEFLDNLFPDKGTRLVPADAYKAAKVIPFSVLFIFGTSYFGKPDFLNLRNSVILIFTKFRSDWPLKGLVTPSLHYTGYS